jgi:hypothetical protein
MFAASLRSDLPEDDDDEKRRKVPEHRDIRHEPEPAPVVPTGPGRIRFPPRL